tara:strand:+ start:154 stop:483 length:330 start_codon:yes stop_codon:yes gene_type:complete
VKQTIGIIVLAFFSLFGTGCGPMISGVKILRARVSLSEAQTAGANKEALYEYTAAEEYFKKAREEHAYSEFWTARRYADKAIFYAQQARQKAETASKIEQIGVESSESE